MYILVYRMSGNDRLISRLVITYSFFFQITIWCDDMSPETFVNKIFQTFYF